MQPHNAIIVISAFLAGLLAGFFLRSMIDKQGSEDTFSQIISFVVIIIWTAAMLREITQLEYQAPVALHALLGGVLGYVNKGASDFFSSIIKKK